MCCEPAKCVPIETVKRTFTATKRNVSYVYYRCRIRNESTEEVQFTHPITEISNGNNELPEITVSSYNQDVTTNNTIGIKNKSHSQEIKTYNVNEWLRKLEKRIQQQEKCTEKYEENETESYMGSDFPGAQSNYKIHSNALLKNNHFHQEDLFRKCSTSKGRIQKRSAAHYEYDSGMKDGTVKEKNNIVLTILDNIKNHTNNAINDVISVGSCLLYTSRCV